MKYTIKVTKPFDTFIIWQNQNGKRWTQVTTTKTPEDRDQAIEDLKAYLTRIGATEITVNDTSE